MSKNDLEKLSDTLRKMRKELNSRLDSLEKNFKKEFDAFKLERVELADEIKRLKAENAIIKGRNQFLERESIRNQILINGLPNSDDTPIQAAIKSFKRLNIDINDDDINYCFKIKNKSDDGNPNISTSVVVKLVRFAKKQQILFAFDKMRRNGDKVLLGERRLFFNDSLPSDVRVIYRESKRLLGEKKLSATWLWRGRVFVRISKTNRRERLPISNVEQLIRMCSSEESRGTDVESSIPDILVVEEN